MKLMLVVVSPMMAVFSVAVITTLGEKHAGALDLVLKSWDSMKHGILLTLVDRYFFGSWMFTLLSFALIPTWLTLWGIVHCQPDV
jgi:hypothetical protein